MAFNHMGVATLAALMLFMPSFCSPAPLAPKIHCKMYYMLQSSHVRLQQLFIVVPVKQGLACPSMVYHSIFCCVLTWTGYRLTDTMAPVCAAACGAHFQQIGWQEQLWRKPPGLEEG